MGPPSVLLAEPDADLRAALRTLLTVASIDADACATAEEALMVIVARRPSVVVAEVALADSSGLDLCRTIRQDHGEEIGVILTSAQPATAADRTVALLLGADDYLAKPYDCGELLARLRRLLVRCGERGSVACTGGAEASRLTQREQEVLQLLADGRSQEEICAALVIAPKTASAHIQRILLKIGAHSRAQAVAIAYRDGLVAAPAVRDEPGQPAG